MPYVTSHDGDHKTIPKYFRRAPLAFFATGKARIPPSTLVVGAMRDGKGDSPRNAATERIRAFAPGSFVRLNIVQATQLQNALKNLSAAIAEAEIALAEMRADRDPLAVHIFVSRRQYRNTPDTKSGKRSEVVARMSWQVACSLGFRGSLDEWERLMGAVSRR